MLQRMVGEGCCTEPAEARVVETHAIEKCCRSVRLQEKCWERVLCNVGEECCRDVL